MSSDFEIYENPEAQVFLRQVRPKIVTDAEVEVVRIGIENCSQMEYYKIDFKDKAIFIYLVNQDICTLSKIIRVSTWHKREKYSRHN